MLLSLAVAACGHTGAANNDAGVVNPDAAIDAAPDAPSCVSVTGVFPRAIAVSGEALGPGDASFAHDPTTNRTWMAYSSVAPGPGDLRLVSTRLAYSDDGGQTFCAAGLVNAAESIATPPPELSGVASYWVHEVSQLYFDALAPAGERWRLVWHRYLLANTGATDERQFQYGWISEKLAASPPEFATAPEHKLFAAAGYAAMYSDTVLGPPEVRVDQLDPALADCVALTEPGAFATSDARWLAISCETGQAATSRIVLLDDVRAGAWHYVGALLGQADAKKINAALDGFTASGIYVAGGTTYLIASPHVGGIYKGCIEYALSLPAGAVATIPARGFPAIGDFAGACAFDASVAGLGVVMGSVDVTATPPTFTLDATGTAP